MLKQNSYFSFFPFLLILILFNTQFPRDSFNWQTLEAGGLKVHWYEGGENFGKDALATSQAGLDSAGSLVPLNLQQPIEIFIYASSDDLKGELKSGKEDWVAGHADPELGIVRVLIEPGPQQGIVMEQRIPHELMHVMLYRHVGAGYNNIPAWLREGTATFAEMYPSVDSERVLADAVANHRLISLRDLCVSFPTDAGQAFLAYAEARSFTGFLYNTYGSSGLMNLATVYADGLDCEHGPERAFSVSLSRLESQWRSSMSGQNTFLPVLQNIIPYLVLLCLVLTIPMIGIVSTLRQRKAK